MTKSTIKSFLLVVLISMFFIGCGEKPKLSVTDQNGMLKTTLTSDAVDITIMSDQQIRQKQMYDELLEKEVQRTEEAQQRLENYRKSVAAGQKSVLKEISGKLDVTNEILTSIDVRVENIENGQKTMNNNMVNGFKMLGEKIDTVSYSVKAVNNTVKTESKKNRDFIKKAMTSGFTSEPIADNPDYGVGDRQ